MLIPDARCPRIGSCWNPPLLMSFRMKDSSRTSAKVTGTWTSIAMQEWLAPIWLGTCQDFVNATCAHRSVLEQSEESCGEPGYTIGEDSNNKVEDGWGSFREFRKPLILKIKSDLTDLRRSPFQMIVDCELLHKHVDSQSLIMVSTQGYCANTGTSRESTDMPSWWSPLKLNRFVSQFFFVLE